MRGLVGLLLALSAVLTAAIPAAAASPSFTEDFNAPAPLGSFSDCNNRPDTPQARCARLASPYRDRWWAYPAGWPDTATQRGYPVGGVYDPARTVWASDGQLHIRLFREGAGPVHSSAVVPLAALGSRSGTYEVRFRVSRAAPGYKSAYLLWPIDGSCRGCEIDFPEGEWTGSVWAFTHPRGGSQDAFSSGARWTDWHTARVEWTPSLVRYALDGRVLGVSTQAVPDGPMVWVLQNEAALNGEQAAPGSWAQIDLDWVRFWPSVL